MNNRQNEYPLEVVDKKVIERITFRKLVKDVGQALNLERGILYLIKVLTINPGAAIRSFLYEKRYNLFHPVRLLILTSALSLFVFWLVDGVDAMSSAITINPTKNDQAAAINEKFGELFTQAFYDYFNIMIWIFVPIISFFSYVFFRKLNYNFAEHLVLNAFITSYGNLINTVFYLVGILINFQIASIIGLSLYLIYNLYVYKSFFRLSIGKTLLKGIMSLVLGYIIYMFLLFFIISFVVGYQMAKMGLFDK